jgi:hypothetical protein
MEKDYFLFNVYCEFMIVSEEVSPEQITSELNMIPDRSFKKGDQSISRHSGSIITKPHNLWSVKSKNIKSKELSINLHMQYLESILAPQSALLFKYKTDSRFETAFYIWIETNDAGVGFDLFNTELSFINNISNRVHLSLLHRESL